MNIDEIVSKKNNDIALTKDELTFVVTNSVNGALSESQIIDFLRAVYNHGMSERETIDFTLSMRDSGDVLHFDDVILDKHSTGGVSDTTSIVIVPVLASLGYHIIKMSGKSLGHTGGTIDKLHIFDGIRTEYSHEDISRLVRENGACMIEQSLDLAPADKIFYKLRDREGLVDCLPLIASSVASKKLASGANVILLDVKCGNGAFMTNLDDARTLATLMTKTIQNVGYKCSALITDMNQPLGQNVGCSLELREAIDVLRGKKGDLRTLCIRLATDLVRLASGMSEWRASHLVKHSLNTGMAYKKFISIMSNQGANISILDAYPVAKHTHAVCSGESGWLSTVQTKDLGALVTAFHDKTAGVVVNKRLGDKVNVGDVLCEIYYNTDEQLAYAQDKIKDIFVLSRHKIHKPKLVYGVIK